MTGLQDKKCDGWVAI